MAPALALVPIAAAGPFLVAAIVEDARSHRLPRHLIRYAAVAAAVAMVALAAATGRTDHLVGAALGAAISFVLLGALWVVAPAGMGFGDVRLAAVTGLLVGWVDPALAPVALVTAFVLAAPVALVVWMRRRAGALPFGPFLVAAALVVAAGGPALR